MLDTNIKKPNALKVYLACIEDGLDNIGFRKFSAYIKTLHPETTIAYVPTGNMRGLLRILREEGAGNLSEADITKIGKFLAKADLVGLCSMTQYSDTVCEIISAIRNFNPQAYIVWGGIHPIIHPEDAIKYADAICTGEGEFAFKSFLQLYNNGEDYTTTPSFWFRKGSNIIKNINLPLMHQKEMDELPQLIYDDGELIYHQGKDFKVIDYRDFLYYNGLAYNTIWSIGCPLKCTYCGNAKFIEYDKGYRRLRNSSPRTIIEEIKRVKSKHKFLSTINFHDDSFLALPYDVLKEFCKLWKEEINMPFAIYGVIPNYVREDKMALLLDAGLIRIRMGIQSGSENILEFYKRPTKLLKINEATKIINKFKRYMIPPVYDIILENPIETAEDTRATIDLLHEMPRPYTPAIHCLRVIPNTPLEQDLKDRGLTIPKIDTSFISGYNRTIGNILVFALAVWRIPNWLMKILRKKVFPVQTKQPHYPIVFKLFRTAYLLKRGYGHLRFMDFTFFPGNIGYFLWKIGFISFWHRFMLKRYSLPEKSTEKN